MVQTVVENIEQDEAFKLFGSRDENLRLLRELFDVRLVARDKRLTVEGEPEQVDQLLKLLERLRQHVRKTGGLSQDEIRHFVNQPERPAPLAEKNVEVRGPMRMVRARSKGQAHYVEAIRDHDLTFCIGPAGTGKTYLAVAMAVEALQARQIKRIVLVRPAVEAGEKLGFLPGDFQAKVHPYLRPLLDALREMLDFEQVRSFLDNDVVEIAPLAYMRGRTLNEAFIILDEGQNTTVPQMQMFLTRMGMGSKIVVTGDVTQVDLPSGVANGLEDAVVRLKGLPRVAVVRMQKQDIVRHPLVEAIVNAYETQDIRKETPQPGPATENL